MGLDCYLKAVSFLAYTLFRPVQAREEAEENFQTVLILAVPISILAGMVDRRDDRI